MTRARFPLAALAGLFSFAAAAAQDKEQPRVKEPPRAAKLDIQIRYRIRADRDQRIRQYRALVKYLESLGFEDAQKNDPDHELDVLDPTAERFVGTIPSAKVLEVLADPRVQQILFAPAGYPYPPDRNARVPIRIALRTGLIPNVQQLLHFQLFQHLEQLGFEEALGYDTRGFTQLKGTIPVKFLDRLVKDIRTEPAGWFLTDTALDRLPRPLADRNPVRWIEVMPAGEPQLAFNPEVVLPARAKMTPDLRAVLADPALKETPLRVIILFAEPMDRHVEDLRTILASRYAPTVQLDAMGSPQKGPDGLPALTEGAALDGVAGNLASIRFDRPADVERFSINPNVLSLRLPRAASETVSPLPANEKPVDPAALLKASGIDAMHKLGYTGAGVKVVVVGTDFTGAEKLIGNGLPKKTRILDLTTELNSAIVPSPSDPLREGNGLAAARALVLAAPDVELVLVRIDPGAIFQLFGVIRVARGDIAYSESLRSRLNDISVKTAELTRRKEAAVNEYRRAFDDLSDDDVTKNRRVRARAALDAVIAEQDQLTKRIQRFNVFAKSVGAALEGARVVVNTLEWETGYPLDAISLLSQLLEQMSVPLPSRHTTRVGDPANALKPPLVWVQAASAAGPSVWGGPFLDPNGDSAMEFAPPGQKLPPMNWSADMNFMGFQVPTGETSSLLPANAKFRITMQWREPLDPNFPSVDRPAFPVILRIFKQLAPAGNTIPSDEMAEVARSAAGPYPILLTKTFVVYEQILDFTPKEAGQYALVVAKGYEPEPQLPALRRHVEVYPRIFLETLNTKRDEGRGIFLSYVTPDAGVGVPGDSLGAITVGVQRQGELFGGGTGLTLRAKPDFFGPYALDLGGQAVRGPGVATGFVGGMAATLVQAGAAGANVLKSTGAMPGKPAAIPEGWMKYLQPWRPKP